MREVARIVDTHAEATSVTITRTLVSLTQVVRDRSGIGLLRPQRVITATMPSWEPVTIGIATHPSDMGVALLALDAQVNVSGKAGDRTMPLAGFHRLPGDTPHLDHNLQNDEWPAIRSGKPG